MGKKDKKDKKKPIKTTHPPRMTDGKTNVNKDNLNDIGNILRFYTNADQQRNTQNEFEKANILANYFSSVFTTGQSGSTPNTSKVNNKLAMDELKVTENIILLMSKKLNISKSPGPDKIGARLLMELSDNICHPL